MDRTQEHAPSLTVAELLHNLRSQRGWSLREIERRSGGLLKSGYLSQVETGKVAQPSLAVLRELARAFNYDFRTFLSLLNVAEDDHPHIDDREAMVLTYFSDLSPQEQEHAMGYLRWLSERRRADNSTGSSPPPTTAEAESGRT